MTKGGPSMRFPMLLVGLLLAGCASLPSQDRTLVLEGLGARVSRWGTSLPEPGDIRDTVIALYPGARFYYADILLEHGGSFRLYQAVDSLGQLYLLDSPADFRLLHKRHYHGKLDARTAETLALLAARFGGILPDSFLIERTFSLPMEATAGGGGTALIGWDVVMDVVVGSSPVQLRYWILLPDGEPMLMSGDCTTWCRATILDP